MPKSNAFQFVDPCSMKHYQVLDTIKALQDQNYDNNIQSKQIISSIREFSSQTAYVTLNDLVENGYLDAKINGKFKFYKLTNKGEAFLKSLKEMHQKKITEPLVKDLIDTLYRKYPGKFENISYKALEQYILKEIKEFENHTIDGILRNFGDDRRDEV